MAANIINTFKKKISSGAKELMELANRFDPQAKFKWELMKPGVRESSLNECRVVATPEKFDNLKRDFDYGIKILSMSGDSDLVASLAEEIIGGINKMFDENNDSRLTESECESIRKVIHEYFYSLRRQSY